MFHEVGSVNTLRNITSFTKYFPALDQNWKWFEFSFISFWPHSKKSQVNLVYNLCLCKVSHITYTSASFSAKSYNIYTNQLLYYFMQIKSTTNLKLTKKCGRSLADLQLGRMFVTRPLRRKPITLLHCKSSGQVGTPWTVFWTLGKILLL